MSRRADAVDLLVAALETPDVDPVVSIGSIKDAYYILCRMYRNEALVRSRLRAFTQIVGVEDLTTDMLDAAFASDEPDLEDGLIRAAAEAIGARAVITRDAGAFRGSSVPSMDARAFCRLL